MNILIVGGTRFIGPGVARRLTGAGHRVTLFHRGSTHAELPDEINHLHGDRCRLLDFADDLQRLEPEIVVDMMLLTESQATDLMTVFSGRAKRVVMISSCDVYRRYDLLRGVETGPVEDGPVDEDAPLRTKYYPYRNMVADKNDRLYDYDKILAERVVMASGSTPATVLRLPVVYGPNDYQHRFAAYLRRMLDGRPAILVEEGEADWRITRGYSENCAEAVATAALSPSAAGRVYNVGEPKALTELAWIRRIAGVVGWAGQIIRLPNAELPKHLQSDIRSEHHLEVDTARIRDELGFTEPIEAEEALRLTLDWQRQNLPENPALADEYRLEDDILARV
jgi:nucleoside-diphosphate-sugar epimerase